MNKRVKEMMVAIVAASAAVVALYLAFGARPDKINLDSYEVLGTVTAEETAKLVGVKGRVLVFVRDTGSDKNPSVEAQLEAFQRALDKHADVSLIVEKVQVTPSLMMSTGGGLPPDNFFKALEMHAKVDAAVLFFGFPQLTDQQLVALKKSGVKTVAVSSFRPGYPQLLERQVIHLAIVPRPEVSSPSASPSRTVRERFDQEYLIMAAGETRGSP